MAFLHFVATIAAGWLLVRALAPLQLNPAWGAWVLRAGLAVPIGSGIASVLYFLLVSTGLNPLAAVVVADGALLSAALAANRFLRPGAPPAGSPASSLRSYWTFVLAFAFAVSVLFFLLAFSEATRANPHGDWDAWSIWNLRAKYLAGGGGAWNRAISPLLPSHPDYPLLTSGFVAGGWALAGGPGAPVVPAATAMLFSLATLAIVTGGLALLRGTLAGLLAGLVLTGNFLFVRWAPAQYADIPLACFWAGAMTLIALQPDGRTALVAGILAALAAWTKNEGIVIAVGIALAFGTMAVRSGRRVGLAWFALGALPLALFVTGFKLLAPDTEPLLQQSWPALAARFTEIRRYGKILGAFLHEIGQMGTFPWHPIAALALGGIALRLRKDLAASPVPGMAAGLGVPAAGYFAAFLATPADLDWHLGTAAGRLLLQSWPAFVLTAFTAFREAASLTSMPSLPAAATQTGRGRPGKSRKKRMSH